MNEIVSKHNFYMLKNKKLAILIILFINILKLQIKKYYFCSVKLNQNI